MKLFVKRLIEKLYRNDVEDYVQYLRSPWRIVWTNFLAGTFKGLGFLLGATLVLTVVGFVLQDVLANIPFIGKFFDAVNQWIETMLQSPPQTN